MGRYLTIRNVSRDLADRLDKEKKRRGTSLNETVLSLLRECLGLGKEPRTNGLTRLAGSWSAEDFEAFEQALELTEQVDEEIWR